MPFDLQLHLEETIDALVINAAIDASGIRVMDDLDSQYADTSFRFVSCDFIMTGEWHACIRTDASA